MTRVMIFGAISLAILFLASTVSSSRSVTITIAEDSDENQFSRRCQQQIQQAHQLRSCQQYLMRQGRSSFSEEREDQGSELPRCCQQLQQIQDSQCRCEGLRQVVQQRGELQGRERQQMLQTAQNLPGLCRLSPQRCEIQTPSWF